MVRGPEDGEGLPFVPPDLPHPVGAGDVPDELDAGCGPLREQRDEVDLGGGAVMGDERGERVPGDDVEHQGLVVHPVVAPPLVRRVGA